MAKLKRKYFYEDEEKMQLDDYGVIFLTGDITMGTTEYICEKIISINLEAKVDHIQLIINSPGGSMYSGFAIIDMMEWSNIPIYTMGMGIIASMGLLIFMSGEKGKRTLAPSTSLLSHRYSSLSFGSHSDLIAKRKEEDILFERLLKHYKKYSNLRTKEEITDKVLKDVDFWFTPEEAIELGFCDKIQQKGF